MNKARYLIVFVLMLMAISFVAGLYFRRNTGVANASTRQLLYWVDPMHPDYKSDKPGIAPDCGMQLEPVFADEAVSATAGDRPPAVPGAVHISTQQQQLIGLRTGVSETTSGTLNMRLSGRVAADEGRVYRVASGTDGYVEKTFHDTSGSFVKRDEVLATIIGSEFLTAQLSYLSSAEAAKRVSGRLPNDNDWRYQTDKISSGRLLSLGMSESQIKRIAEKNQPATSVEVVSPVDGLILARNVSPGQRFDKGAEFYRIADLSHVWIFADIFENEAEYFRPGVTATVITPHQGKKFRARVSDVLPQFDPATRTLKIRLEADNPELVLRPDMFVDVELPTRVPPGLSVPADAILDSGLKKRVFLDRGDGYFEPREVETGWRSGDRVQVTKGLKAGERVVVSGTFLLDSESRLKATTAESAQMKMEEKPGGQSKMEMTKSTTMPAHSVKDPKCGMDVDPKRAASTGNTASHGGKTYYFCSKSCKSAFEKNPEQYLPKNPEGAQHD